MWKSREAFEKSTFFKRLKLQGFADIEGMWSVLEKSQLKHRRCLRLNPLRSASKSDFEAEGFRLGTELEGFPHVFDFDLNENNALAQHPFWGVGLGYVQDAVALEIVRDLDIQVGQWVLDLCAAPGGKSTRIAELLGKTGWLVSNDADLKRARILSGNLIRHGAFRTSVFAKEAPKLTEYFPESFDRILVDAPCSGESLFFKREERRRDVYESEVQECALLQIQILASAAQALRPGGKILYSTCTYNLSENDEVVRRFLKQHENFKVLLEKRKWPHIDNTAGGYWAVLEKSGSAPTHESEMGHHAEAERHALLDREGKVHIYAEAMCEDSPNEAGFEDWILMTLNEASAYLAGEALPNPSRKHGLVRFRLKGKWLLGPAKGVESRFNNLLPVESRVQFRNLK